MDFLRICRIPDRRLRGVRNDDRTFFKILPVI